MTLTRAAATIGLALSAACWPDAITLDPVVDAKARDMARRGSLSVRMAMGAGALSASRKSDEEEAAMLREVELQASYSSASSLGFDEMIDPRETRNVLLESLERALSSRQAVPEPVARVGIMP